MAEETAMSFTEFNSGLDKVTVTPPKNTTEAGKVRFGNLKFGGRSMPDIQTKLGSISWDVEYKPDSGFNSKSCSVGFKLSPDGGEADVIRAFEDHVKAICIAEKDKFWKKHMDDALLEATFTSAVDANYGTFKSKLNVTVTDEGEVKYHCAFQNISDGMADAQPPIPKGSKAVLVVTPAFIWFGSGNWGVTWRTQIIAFADPASVDSTVPEKPLPAISMTPELLNLQNSISTGAAKREVDGDDDTIVVPSAKRQAVESA